MTENPGAQPPRDDEPTTPEGSRPATPPAPGYGPPAGGYPPPAGGYPPPAGDGDGQQPQYGAQQPGYGQPYAGQPYAGQPAGYPPTAGSVVGDGFSWGWTKFTQHWGAMVLGVLAYLAVITIVAIIAFSVLVGGAVASADPETGQITGGAGFALTFGYLLVLAIIVLLSAFMQAGVIRATLEVANGRRVEFATFFRFENMGAVVLAALLVGVGTGIGMLLFVLPGIAFAFYAQFALFFVLDKRIGAVDAIKASFTLVNRNLGTVALLFLGVYAANLVGSAICGVGQLVSFPVGLLATTYVYRRLQNEPVAP
jgi:uncharacterized membrane protein